MHSSVTDMYDDRCICSECSCSCEKYLSDESVCLCSKCSCKCLKDFQNDEGNIQDIIETSNENIALLQTDDTSEDQLTNKINLNEKFQLLQTNSISLLKEQINDENMISDCIINCTDCTAKQYDVFQSIKNEHFLHAWKYFTIPLESLKVHIGCFHNPKEIIARK